MSDIQQAVREKYGAIAASVSKGVDEHRLLRADGLRLRRSDHVEPLLRRRNRHVCRPTPSPRRSAAAIRPRCSTLEPGQTVLDLGSGGGIDVLLSAKRVGPTGKVYGLDMTDEMLALARENQRKAGATNVEFLKGTIESDSAARQLGRRHHLQLRHQPVERQGRACCARPSAC